MIHTKEVLDHLSKLLARDIAEYERKYGITLSMEQLPDYAPTGQVFLGHPVYAHKDVPRPLPMRWV